MLLNELIVRNFRCFENLKLELHPHFNIIIGVNGTGKTAILEALRIALGGIFLEMDKIEDKISTPHIKPEDVRLAHWEKQYPVEVSAKGFILDKETIWSRELETEGGRTKYIHAKEIKKISSSIQQYVRENNTSQIIPLVAFYSTERFKKEKYETGIEAKGSRLRGYYNSLDILTNLKFFLNLFRTEEFAAIQQGKPSDLIEVVRDSVQKCIGDAQKVYHHIGRDELVILKKDGDELPFYMLSDGVRSMLALVMEIAFRSALLNPHLGKDAATLTNGVVLIDEIDLHLHPS
jgi:predicted ATP-binding protein involved in virulence